MRWPTLGVLLAWIVTSGCTGGDRANPGVVEIDDDRPPDTADALIELPPAPVLTSEGDHATGVAGELALGAFDWGPPCRVVVHEVIGTGGPPVARTFTVDVADGPAGDGLVITFDDIIEQVSGLTEEYVAEMLYRNLAVLPAMELDPDGRFVAFRDLDADLVALARRAGSRPPTGPPRSWHGNPSSPRRSSTVRCSDGMASGSTTTGCR